MFSGFTDRVDAGRQLAAQLERYRADRPLIIGLARGGVPVAGEVARRLGAPLDAVVVRKIGAPAQPEYAIGATTASGFTRLNQAVATALRIPQETIDEMVAAEQREALRREQLYRQGREAPAVAGRTVIVVDDGLATGRSAAVALEVIKAGGPKRLIFATPVASREGLAAIRPMTDEIVCLGVPPDFAAVGAWYDDFRATTDREVVEALAQSHP
jgi:predicted phosphoribosyltransferase